MAIGKSLHALLLVSVLALGLASPARADEGARGRPGDFVTNRPASLYSGPSAESKILRQLKPRTVVRVVEVYDQWYKITSTRGNPDGFVRRSYADPLGERSEGGGGSGERRRFKVGIFRLTDPVPVRDGPSSDSRRVTTLRAGSEVRVVDKDPSGLWYKIESETGNRPPGWIPTQAAKRLGDVR